MVNKKPCQDICCPRVLSEAERVLYGWVDEEVFTQPFMVAADMLPVLCREMRLTADRAAEGDYVIEADGPSDRLPFRAAKDRTHFLWVYTELFTRLAASQLHLNGWGFLRTFERVRLHFGFRPSWCVFLYTYQLHAPSPGKGFMSFRAQQGRKLFDTFEESIQEFKRHYFKVLPFPGRRPFWLDDEGAPFPWVYWNLEVGDYRITALDLLETLAFQFLQSLPIGLGKKSKFRCCWILDHSDAEIGMFLDSLLEDMEKQSCFDRLRTTMAEVEGAGPRSILPTATIPAASAGASASSPAHAAASGPSTGATKAKKKVPVTYTKKPISLEGEEGVKEGPATDLRQKRQKRKVCESVPEDTGLDADAAWEHEVDPLDRAFPMGFNFRSALDAGLTAGPVREALGHVIPEQILGIAQGYACKLIACLQVGIENAFAAKLKMEKELAAANDQVAVLIAERDSALTSPPLQAKVDSLTE
ncbi:hypothetical protein PIB30_049161 [Stylosanthes scabra]|uniref:Aminotransferase-like plant mobile domain-containing protein n=1 Tax=Stylosanthes scabra TaxID=79078 RepID=A0ABU6QHF4_9FABA|nr:hypothetical protein [Stylosanthes scabra]